MREASHAVLHGRIDRRESTSSRNRVQGSVAAVTRAGLRRGDRVSHIDGEGFTIILPGADERAGARIADRLRSALLQADAAAGGAARFGVAAGRYDESGDLLNRRARRALDAALSQAMAMLFLPAKSRKYSTCPRQRQSRPPDPQLTV